MKSEVLSHKCKNLTFHKNNQRNICTVRNKRLPLYHQTISLTIKISKNEKEHQQGDSFHCTRSSPHHHLLYLHEPSPFEG